MRDIEASTTFGSLLRRHRLAAGLTQEELAARAGLGTRSIQNLEKGASCPRRESLRLLIDALALRGEHRLSFESAAQPFRRGPRVDSATEQITPAEPHDRSNLPGQLASFVGRELDVAKVGELLARCRLVTLTGPGGVGKTSLALHSVANVGENTRDGICFVSLASLTDPGLVLPTIAHALGVRDAPGRPPIEVLREAIAEKRWLLILDNFEPVVEAAPVIAELLTTCPNARVLATSRVVLQIQGEQVYEVDPLTVPDLRLPLTPERLEEYSAVRLFVERARAVRAAFGLTDDNARAVAEICARVEGLPLAIELAAARTRLLSVSAILERLDPLLPLLSGRARDRPARHQTMHDAIGWSYQLLEEEEKILFRRLAVFGGGFNLPAALAVGSDGDAGEVDLLNGVDSLVTKSLLRLVDNGGETRLRMFETVREYGVERLAEAGELAATRDRHVDWCLIQAKPADLSEQYGTDEVAWLDRIESEHDNMRVALNWCLEHDGTKGLQLAQYLRRFHQMRGFDVEGRRWLELMLARATSDPALRAKALLSIAIEAWDQGDYVVAKSHATESAALFRQMEENSNEAWARGLLGQLAADQGEYDRAEAILVASEKLARDVGDDRALTWSLEGLTDLFWRRGDDDTALAFANENLAAVRRFGSPSATAGALSLLGAVLGSAGDQARARASLEEGVALFRKLVDKPGLGWSLAYLGYLLGFDGDGQQGDDLLREALVLFRQVDHRPRAARTLCFLGILAVRRGNAERAVRLLGAAEELHSHYPAMLHSRARAQRDACLAEARNCLGEQSFERTIAEGRAMTLDQAIAYALSACSIW